MRVAAAKRTDAIVDAMSADGFNAKRESWRLIGRDDRGAVQAPEELEQLTLKIGDDDEEFCDGNGAAVQMIIEQNLWLLTTSDEGDSLGFDFPLPHGKGKDGLNHGWAVVHTAQKTVTVHFPSKVHRQLAQRATGEWCSEPLKPPLLHAAFPKRDIKKWLQRWASMQSDTLYDKITVLHNGY